MIRNLLPLLLVVVVAFLCSSLQAQIPRTLSYQGVILGTAGTPISDGAHIIKITIYDAPTGGASLYSETILSTTSSGLFNVILGGATPLPASLDFSKGYWIGVSVDAAAEMAPRSSLTAVPYSLSAEHAETAEVANGLSSSAKGIVSSVNESTGPIRIQGTGAAAVTTSNGTVTVNVPQAGTISSIQNADSTIVVTNGSGPIAKLSVGKRSISSERLGFNSVANYHIQDKSVTAAKIDAASAPVNYTIISDGSGNVYWGLPTLQVPFSGIVATTYPVIAVANNNNTGIGLRGMIGGGSGQGITGAGVWGDAGANLNGVVGTSSGGVGVLGWGINGTTGVAGVSASGDAINGSSTTGRAGFFQITNTNSTANAIEASSVSSGSAVYGKALNAGAVGSTGVTGENASPSGVGVKASYIGTGVGTPLNLNNGAIKVSGTNKACFVHTVTAANRLTTTSTEIDNALCNGDPNCFLFVTSLVIDNLANLTNLKSQISVYYDAARGKWQILSSNNQVFPLPAYFNVWVIKQ
ncbi:MAG TPA: hypothetical protein VFO76_00470 [Candidatus Kapabacteria bacterium]|nr:hypothetical protein [Candidatus Kapabacteria bacterium]